MLAIGRRTSYNRYVPSFRILGPLEALAADGTQIGLGGPKQRAVLAVLLLRAGEVVSTELLIDALWGEHPPRTAATSLQNSVSALRRLLGPELLLSRAPGYMLALEEDMLDVHQFERLVRDAAGRDPPE